jgi:GTP-sensing pleiotropic transcriptional regulator CodY
MDDLERLEDAMSDSDESPARGRAVADIEIMRAVCEARGPVASAAEIADAVGMTRTGVTNRLHQLDEQGCVASKEVGSGLVWWPDFYPVESDSGD